MGVKIPISFKNTSKEKAIYDFIKDKVNASAYIKELVMEDMKKTSSDRKEECTRKRSIELDF